MLLWFTKQTASAALAAAVTLSSMPAAAALTPVELRVDLGAAAVLAGQRQTAYLKVALNSSSVASGARRAPANVAIVLDKSGSMEGEKIARARDAALLALRRLNGNDIAAVVSYDSTVKVVVPATKIGDRADLREQLQAISADGKTALFAGVSKGAAEVQKFFDRRRVNRVILLSDGIANIGPSTPAALGRLGASLGEEGVTVSTIGLGLDYNEDLMARLASMSDGNHAFAESANDLARIFDAEFGDVLSVTAQDLTIDVHCAPGVRPVRVLGRDADISGQRVRLRLNQLYGGQQKFVLVELELPAEQAGVERDVATVEVDYFDPHGEHRAQLTGNVAISYTERDERVAESIDNDVMTNIVEQVANEMSKDAVELRDAGKIEEASQALEASADYLRDSASQYAAPQLLQRSREVEREAEALDDEQSWGKLRKSLRKKQHAVENQQRY